MDHRKGLSFPVSTYEWSNILYHGTGDFEGGTLKISGIGTPGSFKGVLLKPK